LATTVQSFDPFLETVWRKTGGNLDFLDYAWLSVYEGNGRQADDQRSPE
jgi:hypothetical protein